ncbi:fatty acid desaturase family protein [Pseudarthrobacter sp. J1763]|uniref:fatty acid desaturase family protein n=1 Tax=Pseudarthrobacter sp. J1763 TaxID=3420445 RepID=UPI003D27A68E
MTITDMPRTTSDNTTRATGTSATSLGSTRAPRPNKAATDYIQLTETVRSMGLFKRELSWYHWRMARLGLLLASTIALFVMIGPSWWNLITAALFSFFCAQAAFLGHDAAHRQIYESGAANGLASRILANLAVGLSYGWWLNKHGRHHANPNKVGKDNDIAPGALVFTPEDAATRTGIGAWGARHQRQLFFPILLLLGLDLHRESILRVANPKETVPHRAQEALFLAIRLVALPTAVVLFLGPAIGFTWMGVQLGLFGLYFGLVFAPNHLGMPIVPKDAGIDFLRRQVLMSRNIKGGWTINALMGGLNYQVEHHLFPTMSSRSLRRVQPLVQQFCKDKGIKYTATTLPEAFSSILDFLDGVGHGKVEMFSCPITGAMRTR